MQSSRVSILAVILCLVAGCCLFGPLARKSFALYYGCVGSSDCEISPPSGLYCVVNDEQGGSVGATGGVVPTEDSCAYVYGYSNPGWPCGTSVPSNPPSYACY
jgi:hypothetical protein